MPKNNYYEGPFLEDGSWYSAASIRKVFKMGLKIGSTRLDELKSRFQQTKSAMIAIEGLKEQEYIDDGYSEALELLDHTIKKLTKMIGEEVVESEGLNV